MLKFVSIFMLSLLLSLQSLHALESKDIPPQLQAWQGWVLDDLKERHCPVHYQTGSPQCDWFNRITLSLKPQQLDFNMSVTLYKDNTNIPLPYLHQHWVEDVMVDGKKAVVLNHNAKASLLLDRGEHRITGSIVLKNDAKYIELPQNAALIELYKEGKLVQNPKIESDGRLWFSPKPSSTTQKGTLSVSLYRKIIDGHPIKMQTYLHFRVSGKMRSVVLDGIVLDGFLPTKLKTSLNATINEDKKLQIEVKAGEWTATIDSYAPSPIESLIKPPYSFKYANDEIWSLQSNAAYRTIEITGVSAIDTSQTTLPKAWQTLPTYLIEAGKTMQIRELYKSAKQQQRNELKLTRELWLDFDGQGYTISDKIHAKIGEVRRLDATPLLSLASASINNKPTLITTLSEKGKRGIELREESMEITSSSRYNGDIALLPANGWDEKFERVSTTLHLPPAWRLFGAFGSDNKTRAWLDKWNLMDIFLVLLLSIAIYQLYGWRWSLPATLFLILLWQESKAPTTVWLFLLIFVALLRVLKAGRLRNFIHVVAMFIVAIVVLQVLSFSVYQIRTALYPQLEKDPYIQSTHSSSFGYSSLDAVEEAKEKSYSRKMLPSKGYRDKYSRDEVNALASVPQSQTVIMQNRIDPNALIQTGIAKPKWQWHTYYFSWQSGVASDARLKLWLISPLQNKIIKILTILGMLFLLYMFLREWANATLPKIRANFITKASMLIIPLLIGFSSTPLQAGEIPSPQMLSELKTKLTQPPACLPNCASIDAIHVKVADEALAIEMQVSTGANTAVPLLGNRASWLPTYIRVDESADLNLQLDSSGGLWVKLTEGTHTIQLAGTIENKNQIMLASPLPLHNLKLLAHNPSWQLNSDKRSYIELNRLKANDNKQEELSKIEPLIEIKRTFYFGQRWYIDTQVRLLNRIERPYRMVYNLLPHESILDKEIEQNKGQVVVHLDSKKSHISWRSTLPITTSLQLQASDQKAFIEHWNMDIAPIWAISYKGIEPIKHLKENGILMPSFSPWHSETLNLTFQKAKAVKGESLTIESSEAKITQSSRYRDITLKLTLKSSQAGQYSLNLKGVKELKPTTIDGTTHYLKIDKGRVSIPLKAKLQTLTLKWREEIGADDLYRFPTIELNKESTNNTIKLSLPQNRWILWTNGPLMGPAVLLWGVLLAVLLFALILGRIQGTPLRSQDWLLLGVGVSTTSVMIMLPIVIWIFVLRYRELQSDNLKGGKRNLIQAAIVILTIIALSTIIGAVSVGLLGNPEMMITGNHSYSHLLNWYSDRLTNTLPQPTVFSVSIWYYRALMLIWSIWIAFSLIKWLKWAWSVFSQGDMWHKREKRVVKVEKEKSKDEEEQKS